MWYFIPLRIVLFVILGGLVYLIIGAVVAHNTPRGDTDFDQLIFFVWDIFFWPLVLAKVVTVQRP